MRLAPSTGLVRLLAVLSAIVTMLFWGPMLLGLAFGVADSPGEEHTLWIIMFWWVLIGWPIASAAAVACAVLAGRWPRLAAWLLVAVAVAMGFPTVLNGLVALAAAAFAYLYSMTAPARAEEPVAPKFLRAAAIGVGAVVLILGAAMTVPSVYEWVRADDSGGEQPSEEPAARPFTTPDEAVQDYAERIEPPFLGDCNSAAGDKGACVDASDVSGDEATYTLCFRQKGTCVLLELHRKDGAWAILSETETGSG